MAGFFSELKRRSVVKVGIAYAAASWVVIEIASVLLPIFEAPMWVLRTFTMLIILGFPFALVFSWAFELTPDGLKRTADVPREESITPKTGRQLDFLIIAVLALAVVLLVIDKFVWNAEEPPTAEQLTEGRPSVAVLPFTSRSQLEEDIFFADGMHDELLTRLSKIGSLKVISRTSMMRYRDTNLSIPEIASQLGVATVLEGAVQRAAGNVRINVQLIDAGTDGHLWAEIYDRQVSSENLFAIQSDIAQAITNALNAALTDEEQTQIEKTPTDNLEAYELYLRARQQLALRTVGSLNKAREYLQHSLDLDPDFAPGLALMAETLHLLHEDTGLPSEESLVPGAALIERALAIDPNLGEGYAYLAEIRRHERRYGESEALFEKAIELMPGDAATYNRFHLLRTNQGRIAEAYALLRRAYELNPLVPAVQLNLSWKAFELGRDEEALAEIRRAQELHPNYARAWLYEAWLFDKHGQPLQSLRAMRQLQRLDPQSPDNIDICDYLADLDAEEAALRCVEQFYAQHPGDPVALVLTSRIHLMFGNRETAREAVRASAAKDAPESPLWLAEVWPSVLGSAATNAGEYDLAHRILQQQHPDWFTGSGEPLFDPYRAYIPIAAAFVMLELGETEPARRLLSAVAAHIASSQRARGRSAYGNYDVAVFALLGDSERALRSLEEVAAMGYLTSWKLLEVGPQFESIRNDPRFEGAVETLRAKAAEQRAIAQREGLLTPPDPLWIQSLARRRALRE